MGVRGINLDGDSIISMAILRHVEATGEERAGYLKMRRAVTGEQPNGETAPRARRSPLPPSRCRPSATRKWAPRSSSS